MTDRIEQNEMLACLPTPEQDVLRDHLQPVSFTTKEEINQVGTPLRHVYFPADSAISLMGTQSEGLTVDVAVVGNEGCTCLYFLDGQPLSPCRIVVEIGGTALRLSASTLELLLDRLPRFTQIVRRFNGVLFRHAVLSVGCSQFHSVEQRSARWLLAHRHRAATDILPFTHEFLAEQLGVQRVTISETLADLQRRGLVTYGYGKINLTDIRGLERISCECFSLARQAIDEYLADIHRYRDRDR